MDKLAVVKSPSTHIYVTSWIPRPCYISDLTVTTANFLKAFINKTGIKITVLDKIYLFAKMSFFFMEAISFWQLWFWVYVFFFFISMTYVKMTLTNSQIWWPVSESMSHTKTNKCWHSYQSQASSNLILLHNNTNPLQKYPDLKHPYIYT